MISELSRITDFIVEIIAIEYPCLEPITMNVMEIPSVSLILKDLVHHQSSSQLWLELQPTPPSLTNLNLPWYPAQLLLTLLALLAVVQGSSHLSLTRLQSCPFVKSLTGASALGLWSTASALALTGFLAPLPLPHGVWIGHMWRFPEMGVPLVIIHLKLGFP